MPQSHPAQQVTALRADKASMTRQRLPYFIGVSAAPAGATRPSSRMVEIDC